MFQQWSWKITVRKTQMEHNLEKLRAAPSLFVVIYLRGFIDIWPWKMWRKTLKVGQCRSCSLSTWMLGSTSYQILPPLLVFERPFALHSRVTKGSGWNLIPLKWDILSVPSSVISILLWPLLKHKQNRHFQYAVFSFGDFSCVTFTILVLSQGHLPFNKWR